MEYHVLPTCKQPRSPSQRFPCPGLHAILSHTARKVIVRYPKSSRTTLFDTHVTPFRSSRKLPKTCQSVMMTMTEWAWLCILNGFEIICGPAYLTASIASFDRRCIYSAIFCVTLPVLGLSRAMGLDYHKMGNQDPIPLKSYGGIALKGKSKSHKERVLVFHGQISGPFATGSFSAGRPVNCHQPKLLN